MNENDLTKLNQLRAAEDSRFDIRIARDGAWYFQGTPINRMKLVKLFSTVLKRDEDGEFWLQTPVERGRIIVDDAPFTAVEVNVTGVGRAQQITFRTNLDDTVTLDDDHPLRVVIDSKTREPSPYILVRDNLDALILRPAFYELVELAEETKIDGALAIGVWSNNVFFPLGAIE
ncbi:MAG: DUF1285 domain-containing protein [Alphaproteobacteria bacterium]|nr:DUF1285 domain-containing protein [Alphaproteobacteria bacterium]